MVASTQDIGAKDVFVTKGRQSLAMVCRRLLLNLVCDIAQWLPATLYAPVDVGRFISSIFSASAPVSRS